MGGVIHYPSDEYLTYLMTVDEMMFTDEIDCSDLFGGNSERERIMIFEIAVDILRPSKYLIPILENLYISTEEFLKEIKELK